MRTETLPPAEEDVSARLLDLVREVSEELHPGRKQDPVANIDRLVQCTGWQPIVTIETTVADTLAWWRRFLAR